MPAQCTRMSQPPSSRSTVSRSLPTSASEVWSQRTAIALPPLFLMAPTLSAASAMSATTTSAPWAANRLLKACPIPLAPPVTTARLLVGISGVLPFVLGLWLRALTVNIQKHDNFQNITHRAPTLDGDEEPLFGPRVQDAWERQVSVSDLLHSRPRKSTSLASFQSRGGRVKRIAGARPRDLRREVGDGVL